MTRSALLHLALALAALATLVFLCLAPFGQRFMVALDGGVQMTHYEATWLAVLLVVCVALFWRRKDRA
jgi:hypothetical protein